MATLSITAPNLPALFESAAVQVLSQFLNPDEVGETLQEKVVVDAEDFSSLLEAWLGALLGLMRDQQILPKRIAIGKIETVAGKPYSLRADIVGELLDPHRHSFRKPVAKLKISDARLEPAENGWAAEINL